MNLFWIYVVVKNRFPFIRMTMTILVRRCRITMKEGIEETVDFKEFFPL